MIGDVRGFGHMIGIELVDERGKANGAACNQVLEFCLHHGLILINCGPERNIIRFIPPLTASDEEISQALAIMEQALRALQ